MMALRTATFPSTGSKSFNVGFVLHNIDIEIQEKSLTIFGYKIKEFDGERAYIPKSIAIAINV